MQHLHISYRVISRALLICLACLVGLSLPRVSYAQETDLEAILEANRWELTVDADGLHGAGGTWLVERARNARFTLIGESHLNTETPLLTAGLLKELRPAGYDSYVTESGPVATRLLMEAVSNGGIAAGEAMLTRFPFSIAFLDRREELHTASEAMELGYEVWGIDQEFIGSPRLLFERLLELSASDASREHVQAMLEREMAAFEHFAATGDQSRAFLLTATPDDFEALSAALEGSGEQAALIVDQLRASAEIYQAYAEQRYYENNALRVELIKRNFLAHLERAGGSPLSSSRALIKMGAVHSGRGRTPMHVYDIGNLAAELAFMGESSSFHILVLATGSVDEDGTFTSWRQRSPYLAPIFDLASEENPVLFDLDPLRPLLTRRNEKSEELEELQETALRYDALVLFPRFHPSEAVAQIPGM